MQMMLNYTGDIFVDVGDGTQIQIDPAIYNSDPWSTSQINLMAMDVIDAGQMCMNDRGVPSVNVIVKEKPNWLDKDISLDAFILIPKFLGTGKFVMDKLNCTVSNCCGNMMTISIPYCDDLEITVGSTIVLSDTYDIFVNPSMIKG